MTRPRWRSPGAPGRRGQRVRRSPGARCRPRRRRPDATPSTARRSPTGRGTSRSGPGGVRRGPRAPRPLRGACGHGPGRRLTSRSWRGSRRSRPSGRLSGASPTRRRRAGEALADLDEGQPDLGQGVVQRALGFSQPARQALDQRGHGVDGQPGLVAVGAVAATGGWRPARTSRRRGWPRRPRPACRATGAAARRAGPPARPAPRARGPRGRVPRSRAGPAPALGSVPAGRDERSRGVGTWSCHRRRAVPGARLQVSRGCSRLVA